MTIKFIVWIALTAFFATAGFAIAKTFGIGYAYAFVLFIAPVCYLIKKYGISKFSFKAN
ncbi:hypothetical protein [Pedobacter jamesrossensis]|uniref:Uncharacterized protein n=1 Tax=Pedobacter jamesrossensis TaxID=1908238 RepID=A0ABV8NMB7_9SPHI